MAEKDSEEKKDEEEGQKEEGGSRLQAGLLMKSLWSRVWLNSFSEREEEWLLSEDGLSFPFSSPFYHIFPFSFSIFTLSVPGKIFTSSFFSFLQPTFLSPPVLLSDQDMDHVSTLLSTVAASC